ncbi:MAG: hypothetical protein ACQESB_02415 [Elusimicrobiota bacterium]
MPGNNRKDIYHNETQVAGIDFIQPYSSFILANSLESIGVEFHTANSIAKSLGEEMKLNKLSKISRNELRKRTYEKLKQGLDKKTADKYLKFREFMNSPKPLVLMIGGSTGSGKNTVAVELARRLDIMNVITTDVLREIMRSFFSKEILPMIHSSSYEAHKNIWLPIEEGRYVETLSFKEQSLRVNAAVRGIIARSIKENTSVIINGVHILPGIILPSEFKKANLAKVFIYVKDKDDHKKRFYIRGMASQERGAQKYLDHFDTIRNIQDYILKLAQKQNYMCIDNKDSRETAIKIIDYAVNRFA